ncbi:MAG: hypothetical protein ACRDTT_23970, partial [Pseudonocardiaceae bacterium]
MYTELLATTPAQLVVPAAVLTEACYFIEARNGTRADAAFLTELVRSIMTLEPPSQRPRCQDASARAKSVRSQPAKRSRTVSGSSRLVAVK